MTGRPAAKATADSTVSQKRRAPASRASSYEARRPCSRSFESGITASGNSSVVTPVTAWRMRLSFSALSRSTSARRSNRRRNTHRTKVIRTTMTTRAQTLVPAIAGHCCGTHLPLPALGLWYAKRQGWHSAAGKRLSASKSTSKPDASSARKVGSRCAPQPHPRLGSGTSGAGHRAMIVRVSTSAPSSSSRSACAPTSGASTVALYRPSEA
mmetsp:Transcript_4947/g.15877  ORF Transcript_4947/g.15877 Transcript_4947/m.15877 type:complete len:211 (+) Transcript_4947:212-844(+)